jgi:hypothetical protein
MELQTNTLNTSTSSDQLQPEKTHTMEFPIIAYKHAIDRNFARSHTAATQLSQANHTSPEPIATTPLLNPTTETGEYRWVVVPSPICA